MNEKKNECGCSGGMLYVMPQRDIPVGITVISKNDRASLCDDLVDGRAEEVLFRPVNERTLDDHLTATLQDYGVEIEKLPANANIRRHFEVIWGFPNGIKLANYSGFTARYGQNPADLLAFASDHDVHELKLTTTEVLSNAPVNPELILKSRPLAPNSTSPDRVRFYILDIEGISDSTANRTSDLNQFRTDFFKDYESYIKCWNRIKSFALSCANIQNEPSYRVLPVIEDVNLAGPILLRKLQREYAAKQIGDAASSKADQLLNTPVPDSPSPDFFEDRTEQYMALKSLSWEANDRYEAIRSLATNQGFKVEINANQVVLTKLPVAKVYVRDTFLKESPSELMAWANKSPAPDLVKREGAQQAGSFEIKSNDIDPWVEVEAKLRLGEQNNPNYQDGMFTNVLRFTRTDDGYISTNGATLEQVMFSCARDETLRRATALLIPLYDSTLSDERILVAYRVVKRPLSGILPMGFPKMSLVESQEFFTQSLKAEAGEIVSIVNLAPGEQRNATLTQVMEQEFEYKTSLSTLVDVNLQNSFEFVAETEKEKRRETSMTGSTSMELNTNASIPLKIISLGMETNNKASITGTITTFERELNKTMSKTASSLQRRYKKEVSTNETTRIKSSRSSTTTYSLKNINEGRTLNLVFHTVRRRIRGGLRLTDLEIQVTEPVELVQGTGVTSSRRYSFHQDSLQEAFAQHFGAPTPCDAGRTKSSAKLLIHALSEKLGSDLVKKLKFDYQPECPPTYDLSNSGTLKANEMAFLLALRVPGTGTDSGKFYFMDPAGTPGVKLVLDLPVDEEPLVVNKIDTNLNLLVPGVAPIRPRTFSYPQPGLLYLDAQVGAMPATEEYYERLRQQEVLGKMMNSYETYAKSLKLEEDALRRFREIGDGRGPMKVEAVHIREAEVKAPTTAEKLQKVELTLTGSLTPSNNWAVFWKDRRVKEGVTIVEQKVLFDIDPSIPLPDDALTLLEGLSLVQLKDQELKVVVGQGRMLGDNGQDRSFFDRISKYGGAD